MSDSSTIPHSPSDSEESLDVTKLTRNELREEIEARTAVITEVSAIIDENDLNHRTMDQEYRLGLVIKRRLAIAERRALRIEFKHRPNRVERHAIEAERDKARTQLFVKAANRVLTTEQFLSVWEFAQTTWPEHDAWNNFNPGAVHDAEV